MRGGGGAAAPPARPAPDALWLWFRAQGWGKLVGPNEVSVDLVEGGTATLKAKNIMIATGSEVAPLPGVPVDEDK